MRVAGSAVRALGPGQPPTTSRARPTMPNDTCIVAACTSKFEMSIKEAHTLAMNSDSVLESVVPIEL